MGELYELVPKHMCSVDRNDGDRCLGGTQQVTVFGHTAFLHDNGSLTWNGVLFEPWRPRINPGTGKLVQWCPQAKVETEYSSVETIEDAGAASEPELMVLGGLEADSHCPSPGYTYNLREDTWRENTALQVQRDEAAIVSYRNRVYAIGGFSNTGRRTLVPSMEIYNIEADRWFTLAPMTAGRRQAGAVVVDDALYVVGGKRARTDLSSFEVFSEKLATWANLDDMPTPRSGLGLVVLGTDLYACGGRARGFADFPLDTVEIYNVETKSWRQGTQLNTARSDFGIATVGTRIFAIGGTTNDVRNDGERKNWRKEASVECYEHGQWFLRAPMPTPRSHLSVAVLGSCIYVIGGSIGPSGQAGLASTTNVIEVYDTLADRWFPAHPLPAGRWGHGSVWVTTSRTLAGLTSNKRRRLSSEDRRNDDDQEKTQDKKLKPECKSLYFF